jgi:hypothetical protein
MSKFREAKSLSGDAGSRSENRKSKIGLVGPMSNYAAPPQLVEDVGCARRAAGVFCAGRWRQRWFIRPPPPQPPLCKVGSQSARDSLALGAGGQPPDRRCLESRRAGDMLVGDTDRVAWPCDQGTSRGRVSQLTENSSKIGSPTGDRASDAGLDFSDLSELAKKENHHILYLVDRWPIARGCVAKRGRGLQGRRC